MDVGRGRAPVVDAVEIRRDDDGELVGLVLPGPDGSWTPATVFGAALGAPADRLGAESAVRERGLSSLAERWSVRQRDGGEWRDVWLLEVKSDRVRLRWDDPMLMAGGHGEGIRLNDVELALRPR